MKKLVSIVLALALVLLTVGAAFADTPVEGTKFTYTGTGATTDGKITLSNATKDYTYTLYKIFDATYSGSNVAYTIKDGALKTALQSDSDFNQYFVFGTTADSNGNFSVTRAGTTSGGTFTPTKTDAELLTFIKKFTSNYTEIGAIKASAQGTIEWEKIPYGYYYILPDHPASDAAVTIDSAKPTATVIDKNQTIPTPDKQESVDGGTTWKYQGVGTTENPIPTAQVGSTVNYKVTGSFTQYVGTDVVKALKFKDTMSNGLTADQNVVVKINNTELTTYNKVVNGAEPVKVGSGDTIQYTVTYTLNNNGTTDNTTDDYWVTDIVIPTATVSGDNVTFIYNPNNTYELTYSAKVDKDAVIDQEDQNTVDLKYTNKTDTDTEIGSDTTKVHNYRFDLVKLDGAGKSLTGAEFKLWADNTKTTAVKLVAVTAGSEYRVADATETTADATITAGTVVIKGLKTGSYWLEETKAPNGYNKIQNLIEVKIEDADKTATFYVDADTKPEGKENGDYKEGGVSVINNAGTELPSTGGIGTTIFYILGGLLVVGAAVILVARRKAGQN